MLQLITGASVLRAVFTAESRTRSFSNFILARRCREIKSTTVCRKTFNSSYFDYLHGFVRKGEKCDEGNSYFQTLC